MSARLSHAMRSAKIVRLRVYPNDGRFAEDFLVEPRELRRFAWAVLADLDPAEARLAAAEEGVSLESLCAALEPVRSRRDSGSRPHDPRLPAVGTFKRKILEILRGGIATTAALGQLVPEAKRISSLTCELKADGYLVRTDGGGAGDDATWMLSAKARERLALEDAGGEIAA